MTRGADPIVVPGGRDVRATLDVAAGPMGGEGDDETDTGTDTIVVACPPHPQYGGSRADSRLKAVSAALCERGISCLRFDYGPWDDGRGERVDARNACRWAVERYDAVGLFGYSFGATTALLVASETTTENVPETPRAVSVLAPDRGGFGDDQDTDDDTDHNTDHDAVAAIGRIESPVQVLCGERDETVEWGPVVARARERGFAVEALPADHFFVGQSEKVAARVGSFLAETMR